MLAVLQIVGESLRKHETVYEYLRKKVSLVYGHAANVDLFSGSSSKKSNNSSAFAAKIYKFNAVSTTSTI